MIKCKTTSKSINTFLSFHSLPLSFPRFLTLYFSFSISSFLTSLPYFSPILLLHENEQRGSWWLYIVYITFFTQCTDITLIWDESVNPYQNNAIFLWLLCSLNNEIQHSNLYDRDFFRLFLSVILMNNMWTNVIITTNQI